MDWVGIYRRTFFHFTKQYWKKTFLLVFSRVFPQKKSPHISCFETYTEPIKNPFSSSLYTSWISSPWLNYILSSLCILDYHQEKSVKGLAYYTWKILEESAISASQTISQILFCRYLQQLSQQNYQESCIDCLCEYFLVFISIVINCTLITHPLVSCVMRICLQWSKNSTWARWEKLCYFLSYDIVF